MLRKTLAEDRGWRCADTRLRPKPAATAKATLVNSQGQKVGEATLTQAPEGVKIVMKVENLPPGEHAFHIHAKGACATPEFEAPAATLIPSASNTA